HRRSGRAGLPRVVRGVVIVAALGGVAALAAAPGIAAAKDSADTDDAGAYVRIIAQRASVHSGPGASYREVYVAERDQVFRVIERGTRDYWFKIELDDGTTGWILGDLVYPFEVGEPEDIGALTAAGRAIRRTLLGPSAVPYAD